MSVGRLIRIEKYKRVKNKINLIFERFLEKIASDLKNNSNF